MGERPHYIGHRQRLKERFASHPEALPDYELLELILCQALPRRDVKPLAKALIRRFGGFAEVISAERDRLMEVDGIGESAATSIKLVQEAVLRFMKAQVINRPVISSWTSLLDYCRASMGFNKREQFRVLYLDRKNRLIADEVGQEGTVDHTPVYPREVVKRALELGSSAVILVHNHPSGDPTPSREDVTMTQEIIEAGRKLGIQVHDHIIISKGAHASFKALGLI